MESSITSMEYVIYCRKSTDESSEHQKQSIPDQIRACMDYAKREWLIIAKKPKGFSDFESETEVYKEENESDISNRRVFEETKNLFIVKEQETWKIPYKRKKWRKIIEMIQKWKIRWLLSYAPDRQARNMLEGGELINYVDEWLIDLKYTNFHFENNASGKMMLGIWFVFSKQYSDKLSEDITRWNKNKASAGKAVWRYFPGYQINKDWFHEPHPINFPLIQEAFIRKLDGETDEKIAESLNANWYKRTLLKSEDELEMNAKNIYKLWINPFYYGIFIHGKTTTDIADFNPYYKSIITEEQYWILKGRYDDKTKRKPNAEKLDIYDEICPFENGFIQTEDGHGLTFTLPNKKRFFTKLENEKEANKNISLSDIVSPNQIYYRCGNHNSKYYNLQVTASQIDKAITKKLEWFKVWEKEFKQYLDYARIQLNEIDTQNQEKNANKILEINRLKSDKTSYIDRHMGIKKDIEENRVYEAKKADYEAKIRILKGEMEDIDESDRNESMEVEAFMNVLCGADSYYKDASYVQKRKITKILFSNIVLDHTKRLHIAVKPWLEQLFPWMVEIFGADLNKEKSLIFLNQIRDWLKNGSPSMIRTLISLYITDFWWGKTALQQLSPKQKRYYQIDKAIDSSI